MPGQNTPPDAPTSSSTSSEPGTRASGDPDERHIQSSPPPRPSRPLQARSHATPQVAPGKAGIVTPTPGNRKGARTKTVRGGEPLSSSTQLGPVPEPGRTSPSTEECIGDVLQAENRPSPSPFSRRQKVTNVETSNTLDAAVAEDDHISPTATATPQECPVHARRRCRGQRRRLDEAIIALDWSDGQTAPRQPSFWDTMPDPPESAAERSALAERLVDPHVSPLVALAGHILRTDAIDFAFEAELNDVCRHITRRLPPCCPQCVERHAAGLSAPNRRKLDLQLDIAECLSELALIAADDFEEALDERIDQVQFQIDMEKERASETRLQAEEANVRHRDRPPAADQGQQSPLTTDAKTERQTPKQVSRQDRLKCRKRKGMSRQERS